MSSEDIQIARVQSYVGQRVYVEDAVDGAPIVGILTSYGPNRFFPHWGLCAIIGRFPLRNIKPDQITLFQEKRIFHNY